MIHAIRAEWIKLRSVRANLILICIAIGVPIVLSVLLASLADFGPLSSPEETFGTTVIAPALLSCYLSGVLGILGIGQEYRHNTIRVTFAAQPRRAVVLGAKTIVYGAFGLGVAFLTSSLCLVASSAIASGRNIDYTVTAAPFIGLLVLCVLMTLFAFGIGCIIRQPAGAIPIFLLWPLLVEGLLSLIFSQVGGNLARWLPFQRGQDLATVATYTESSSEHLSRVGAGLYFGLWTLAIVGLGWWLVERRDA